MSGNNAGDIIGSGEMRAEEIPAVSEAGARAAGEPEVNNFAGIINAGVNAQIAEGEINIESFSSDIARIIAERAHGLLTDRPAADKGAETFEIRLRLRPEALGEVFLRITYRDGNVGLNIMAANAAAERAILSQMGELRDSLDAEDINLTEFNLSNFENNAHQQGERGQNGGESRRSTVAQDYIA
jgi:flagellar hook-length control protein FliK